MAFIDILGGWSKISRANCERIKCGQLQQNALELKINPSGVDFGSVVAGIVGHTNPRYSIYGETVSYYPSRI